MKLYRPLISATSLLTFCSGILAADPVSEAGSARKRLAGGIHAFVVSGAYQATDLEFSPEELNAKFKAAGDAFEAYLRRVIPPGELTELVRLEGNAATKKGLEDILESIGRIQDNSLIIFYFCGHGFRKGEKPTAAAPDAPDMRPTCLALFGCDPSGKVKNSNEVSLCTSSIAATLDAKPNLNFMVFLDCCHAGAEVPLLTNPQVNSYNIHNRGFFMAASTADQLSFNCNFTNAVLKIWADGSFDKSETLHSFASKITAEINEGKPVTSQFAKPIVGNAALPLGWISSDACVLFLQLSPPPAPAQYLVSIEGSGSPITTQQSPGTTMLLLTVPRKECTVKISGAFKPWKGRVDFRGRPYYPLQVVLGGFASKKPSTLSKQQLAIEADYTTLLSEAGRLGLSLATIGLDPIRNARQAQPLLNTAPLVKTFLARFDDVKDQSLAESELVKAAGYLARNEPLPTTAEGLRLAAALRKSGIGGEALLSQFNYDCFALIANDPGAAANELAFENADAAKNNLLAFFANGLRQALVSRNETLIKVETQHLLTELSTKPRVLRQTDYDRIRTLRTVAVRTYKERAVPTPAEDQPIDFSTIKKMMDYQTVINNTDLFTDSDYVIGTTSKRLTTRLLKEIDKGPETHFESGNFKLSPVAPNKF